MKLWEIFYQPSYFYEDEDVSSLIRFIKAEDRAINIGDEDIIDLRPRDGDIFPSAR